MVFPLKPPFSYGFPMVFPLKLLHVWCMFDQAGSLGQLWGTAEERPQAHSPFVTVDVRLEASVGRWLEHQETGGFTMVKLMFFFLWDVWKIWISKTGYGSLIGVRVPFFGVRLSLFGKYPPLLKIDPVAMVYESGVDMKTIGQWRFTLW